MKKCFRVLEHPTFVNVALLFIRIVAGLAFTIHGWGKMHNPFGWMGPTGFAPPIFQLLAAVAEFGGGMAWILGFVTPLACFGILCTMAVAFSFHAIMRGDPFVSMTGGPAFELAAVYFSVALVLFAAGPGRFSLDRKIFGPRRQERG